jgi:hypothetical protein
MGGAVAMCALTLHIGKLELLTAIRKRTASRRHVGIGKDGIFEALNGQLGNAYFNFFTGPKIECFGLT